MAEEEKIRDNTKPRMLEYLEKVSSNGRRENKEMSREANTPLVLVGTNKVHDGDQALTANHTICGTGSVILGKAVLLQKYNTRSDMTSEMAFIFRHFLRNVRALQAVWPQVPPRRIRIRVG